MTTSSQKYLSELPLDIHISKLIDWLISRRHCIPTWYSKNTEIKASICSFLESGEIPNKIKNIFDTDGMNIFSLKKAIDLYEEINKVEYNNKNSVKIDKLTTFLNDLRQNGIGLGSVCAQLIHLMDYDLVNIKKSLNETNKKLKECEVIFQSKDNSVNSITAQFMHKCEKIGIRDISITDKIDILSSLNSLPSKFEEIFENFKLIVPSVCYYCKFIQHIHSKNTGLRCNVILRIFRLLSLVEGENYDEYISMSSNLNTHISIVDINEKFKCGKDRILRDLSIKNAVLIELEEILNFIDERALLLSKKNYSKMASTLDRCDETDIGSESDLYKWINYISQTIKSLENGEIETLLLLENSYAFRSRFELELYFIQEQYTRVLYKQSIATSSYNSLIKELSILENKFNETVSKTIHLNEEIKKEISNLYDHRAVNLLSPSNKYLNIKN